MLLTIGLSLLIGLLLGLLGGGGSILTVPMLVYLLHIEPKTAIATSFVVVGVSSLMALIPHARRGTVCWKSGLFFGISGMAGAFGGGHLAGHFSGELLMSLFGLVVLVTGLLMLRGGPAPENGRRGNPVPACPLRVPFLRVLFDGFFVGALTGMVGVGGGFLIVPALTLLVGLPMQGAIGTSLLVIVMNAVAGFSGYSRHVGLDIDLTLIVAGGAIAGSAAGALLSAYLRPGLLRRLFAWMVLLVAAYTLSQSLSLQLLDKAELWILQPDSPERLMAALLLLWLFVRIGSWIHKTDAVILPPADVAGES